MKITAVKASYVSTPFVFSMAFLQFFIQERELNEYEKKLYTYAYIKPAVKIRYRENGESCF